MEHTHHLFVESPFKTTFSWNLLLFQDIKTFLSTLQLSSLHIVQLIFGSVLPACAHFENLLETTNHTYINFGPAQRADLMAQCFRLGWAQKIEAGKKPDHFDPVKLAHGPNWACIFILFLNTLGFFFC